MTDDVPPAILAPLRAVCTALPEVVEERAWVGVRWRVRSRTFAHVLTIQQGWPAAYAKAAATDGPAHVLMFRSEGPELDALRHAGPPFFAPVWRADEIGMVLPPSVDWVEIEELVTDSYCVLAPRRLRAEVRPDDAE